MILWNPLLQGVLLHGFTLGNLLIAALAARHDEHGRTLFFIRLPPVNLECPVNPASQQRRDFITAHQARAQDNYVILPEKRPVNPINKG